MGDTIDDGYPMYPSAGGGGGGKNGYDVVLPPDYGDLELEENGEDFHRWEDQNCGGQPIGTRLASPVVHPPDTPSPYMRPAPMGHEMLGSNGAGDMLPPAWTYMPVAGGQARPSNHHSAPDFDSSRYDQGPYGGCYQQPGVGSGAYCGGDSSAFNAPYLYHDSQYMGPPMSQGHPHLLESGRPRLQCPSSGHKAMKQSMPLPCAPDQYQALSMKHEGRQRLEKSKPKHTGGWVAPMLDSTQCDFNVNCTTAMLRNIPNKYTRDMLKERLNHEFRGKYNFLYLPIDFKNKCNVGYGFINFISSNDCQLFAERFHNVEVQACLPGLNSRKVAAVTAARVQGYDKNVRRLLNGPVMGELLQNPLWMPLVFDDNGEEIPFPMPQQVVISPLKHRKKPGMGGRADRENHH